MGILADPIRKITGAKPARRGGNVRMLALALVALLVARVVNVFDVINRRIHKTPFGMTGCTLYPWMRAPEDIVPVFDDVVLASSDERRTHLMKAVGVAKAQMGQLFAIWRVNSPGKDPMVAPLALKGFPDDTAFHPHGMYNHPETAELFVVNHAYKMGGERIDVFKVEQTLPQVLLPRMHRSLRHDNSEASSTSPVGAAAQLREDREDFQDNGDGDRDSDQDGDADGTDGAKGEPRGRPVTASGTANEVSGETAPIKATYSFSVEHELITSSFGILSDLVLVGYDELYVTQIMPLPFPVEGPAHPASLLETLGLYASRLLKMTRLARPPIIYCTRIRSKEIECKHIARGHGITYSGIAVSPDKKRLLVSDFSDLQVLVFNRSLTTGALTLQQRLKMPGSPKNIELDYARGAEGEEVYSVGLQHPWDVAAYSRVMEGASDPAAGDKMRLSGGVAILTFEESTGRYSSSLEMWRNDSLYAISSAAVMPSGVRLLGSSVSPGFMLCRRPSF